MSRQTLINAIIGLFGYIQGVAEFFEPIISASVGIATLVYILLKIKNYKNEKYINPHP